MAKFQGTIGDDRIIGTDSADIVEGKAGNDIIKGLGGNDLLKGDGGHDRIYGGSGRDEIQGDAGNDRLFGNGGNDILEGGIGNDFLRGGSGSDLFVFGDVNGGQDRIADFQDGLDRIEFDLDTVNSMNDLTIRQLAGGNTLVEWDTGSVVLVDFSAASLTVDDFLF